EVRYMFRHALAQETIYDSLLIETRKRMHGKVATVMEEIYSGRTDEVITILAYHYAKAQDWPRALDCLLKAAEYSSQIAADDEALQYYDDAISAYSKVVGEKWDRSQRATIERRLAEIYFRRGDAKQGNVYLQAALRHFGDGLPVTRDGARWA